MLKTFRNFSTDNFENMLNDAPIYELCWTLTLIHYKLPGGHSADVGASAVIIDQLH